MAVGAIEPRFYEELLRMLGSEADDLPAQMDHQQWPQAKARLAQIFRRRTREEGEALFVGSDCCVTPARVLLPPPHPGEHTLSALLDWGFDGPEVEELEQSGAIAQWSPELSSR